MKLIDFDDIFNRKTAEYVAKYAKDRSEEELENFIARAYNKFGDTLMPSVGKTPRQYFRDMSDSALTETLKEYLLQNVTVPDLLCEEMEKRGVFAELLDLLGETDEELVHFAIDLIGPDRRALPRYAEMLAADDYDEHIKNAVVETLRSCADEAAELVLPLVKTENDVYALEILSEAKVRDERIYDALRNAFLQCEKEEIPLYAGYLAAYGDARVLPDLYEAIERDDIDFAVFQELKFAIEALGGEYEKIRDFSEDASYKKIKGAGGVDIFGNKEKA